MPGPSQSRKSRFLAQKKMLSGEDFLGGEVQNSVNLPMVRFFDNFLGLIFLGTCLDLRLLWKTSFETKGMIYSKKLCSG